MTLLTRRSLLGGIGALLAAPAIVRAASLMPVKTWADPHVMIRGQWIGYAGSFGKLETSRDGVNWYPVQMPSPSLFEYECRRFDEFLRESAPRAPILQNR